MVGQESTPIDDEDDYDLVREHTPIHRHAPSAHNADIFRYNRFLL
jgi:hypothetical protein